MQINLLDLFVKFKLKSKQQVFDSFFHSLEHFKK